jgi:uncharacterized membrane protein
MKEYDWRGLAAIIVFCGLVWTLVVIAFILVVAAFK